MNIVLIGMRGSGKTTVAKIISKNLGKEVVEMDEMIRKKTGLTIPEIVEKYGWEHFRDRETDVVNEVAKKDNIIISTGGGVVERPKNIAMLKQNGKIFWLKVSVDNLLSRIGEDANRPSLTGKKSRREDMKEILTKRKELYANSADEIIETDLLDEKKVANLVVAKLNNQG